MPRVRNLSTGKAFDVPATHWSLTDGGYEVLPESGSAPATTPKTTTKAAPKRKTTKKVSEPRDPSE